MNENPFELISMPASREPVSLLAVDRAVSELRRGRFVVVGGGVAVLVQAAEGITPETLLDLRLVSHQQPILAITARRAAVLGLAETVGKVVTLAAGDRLSADLIQNIADPLSENPLPEEVKKALTVTVKETPTYDCESAAVALMKLARLLPSAVTAEIADPTADDLAAWTARHDFLLVDAGDIFQYDGTAARTLRAVSSARVPLPGAQQTRIIAFRPLDGGLEHLAIVIGEPDKEAPVLTRLHSECFTGDVSGWTKPARAPMSATTFSLAGSAPGASGSSFSKKDITCSPISLPVASSTSTLASETTVPTGPRKSVSPRTRDPGSRVSPVNSRYRVPITGKC